jgi:hypothetical protein
VNKKTLDLQNKLIALGILDPPADGIVGPDTRQAMAVRDPVVAVDTSAKNLATAVWRAMENKGYWLARVPGYVNIAYVENSSGPNQFNDLRLVFTVRDGAPYLLGKWEATTEPGRYYTDHPMNPKGAARIAFGQYKAWVVGTHAGSHEALVQRGPIRVHRDLNRDYSRLGDAEETGSGFGINQHWGYDLPHDDIGKASAGCLVGRTRAGHRRFMAILKQDPRYRANPKYRFMTAILAAADIQPYL